jgi:hypothetical protein
VEVEEQYQIRISNIVAALENLIAAVDINRACESTVRRK